MERRASLRGAGGESIMRPPDSARHWTALAFAAGAVLAIAVNEMVSRWYYARTDGPSRLLEEDERTAWTPIWREITAPAEVAALLASPTCRGTGVPRGDGSPVLLVAGFLTRGAYLGLLRGWLERVGYRARVADIGWNAECLDVLADRLIGEMEAIRRETGSAAHLVGHSLGGILARAAAARAPDAVGSVAVLGSPFRGMRIHPSLRLAAQPVRVAIHARHGAAVFPACHTFACRCETVRALAAPLPADLPQLAIASRRDGLADWRYCVDPAQGRVACVDASHLGLPFDRRVYALLAEHLAAARAAPRAAATQPPGSD